MSNSPLATYTRISPNRTSPRNHKIDTVTIHCAVGNFTAKQIVDMSHFVKYDEENGASCNYAVGWDGSIAMGVEEKDRSWCSSNRANDHRAITIEVASDTTPPYRVTDEAYHALIKLLVDICKRNGIKELKWCADKSLIGQVDKQNMTVHRWFANKACPGDYLYGHHSDIARQVNKLLVELPKFKELFNAMREELRDNDASSYSEEAREWSVRTGLIQGSDSKNFNGLWEDYLTREQLVTILYRFAKHIDKA